MYSENSGDPNLRSALPLHINPPVLPSQGPVTIHIQSHVLFTRNHAKSILILTNVPVVQGVLLVLM